MNDSPNLPGARRRYSQWPYSRPFTTASLRSLAPAAHLRPSGQSLAPSRQSREHLPAWQLSLARQSKSSVHALPIARCGFVEAKQPVRPGAAKRQVAPEHGASAGSAPSPVIGEHDGGRQKPYVLPRAATSFASSTHGQPSAQLEPTTHMAMQPTVVHIFPGAQSSEALQAPPTPRVLREGAQNASPLSTTHV